MADPRLTDVLTDDDADWTLETNLRCSHDLTGRLLSVSPAAAHALGYDVEELLKIPLGDLVVPEFHDEFHRYLDAIRETGSEIGLLTLRTRAGTPIVWEFRNSLHNQAAGPVVIGAARDVTDRIRNEQALSASEERFGVAFYSSPIAMAITTLAEGRYVEVNDAFERQMGYARREICGRTSLELAVWPTQADREAMVAALLEHKTVRDQNAQFRTKAGALITTLYSAGLITFEQTPCILAAIVDITAQKIAENALRESEAKFRMLAETSPYGIIFGGKDHRVRFCNPAFHRIFQYSEDEVIGRDPDDLVGLPEEPDAREASARVLRGEIVHATAVRRRKDGSKVDVEFHAVPLISDNEFVGCFGIYQDVTERIRSEAKLRTLRDRLTRVQDDERAHIARELHDDIGQRLALLAIQLGQLQQEAHTAPPSLRTQLEASTQLAKELCADAQRVSYRLHPTPVAVLGLPNALASLCAAFARQTGVEIDFVHDEIPPLPPEISTCLYRIAQEAIQNATKHSDSRDIVVKLMATADAIHLSVADSGRGFDQAGTGYNAGLGLVSMAERARSMGGRLSVRSAVNQGTRIEASIPLR